MIYFEPLSLYLVLISQSLLLGAACIALSKFQRRCREIESFWQSPTGAMLAEEQEDISHKADEAQIMRVCTEEALLEKLKMDQRINELQRRLSEIADREPQANVAPAVEIERNLPIEHALRMAKNGASVDDLTQACGLNIGEARLLQKLHGRSPSSPNEEAYA